MEIRARYVLMGLFTLAVIASGFGFVYWLDTAGSLGKRTSYEVRFHNTVSGLLTGSAVLFNGIRVGEVSGLRLVPGDPRLVDATISVNANTPVRADTQASLEFQGLTGVAAVTLTGGSPDAPLLSAPPGALPKLLANEAAGQSMSEAARQALNRVDKILSDNQSDLRSMISNLTAFSEALGRNSGKVDSLMAGLERLTGGGGKGSGTFYNLSAMPAPAQPTPLGKQIAVADPNALLAFDSEKILSQSQAGQLEPLGNAKWSDTLPKLMQARLIQSFENSGSLGEVNRPIEGVTPDMQLLTEIRRFQIVQAPEPAAEVEISAKLVSADGHIAAARVFSAKAPVKSPDEAEAARALGEAFNSIEASLIAWTRSAIAEGGEQHAAQEKPAGAAKKR
jgi:phospholipid/cholesterol/gamma-HCH transport system substrate-binding protein